MHIALNARHMMKDRLEGIGTVTHEVMNRIVDNHPEDRFDYYFDRDFHNDFIHGPTVSGHSFFPPARLPFLIRYWMNRPVRKHIHASRPDVFFSPDGFLPVKLNVPKVTMVHDIAFLRNPLYLKPRIRQFYANHMASYVQSADHIITVSDFSKHELVSAYHLNPEKVSVVHNGVSKRYQPISVEAANDVRNSYFEGRSFFLYLGAIHPRKNILTLVRAFEDFKERTGSDFLLVIAGRPSWHTADVFNAINKSKWRESIHLPGFVDADTARKFLASAHVFIYPSRYEGFGLPVVEAMASGVPVICSNVSSLKEIAEDSAMYFEPDDVDALSLLMEEVSTDFDLRHRLILDGQKQVERFSWDKAADAVYKILQKVSKS